MSDEDLYARALAELDSDQRISALYTKAFALAGGDSSAQRAKYIELRVAQLAIEEQNAFYSQRAAYPSTGTSFFFKFAILATLAIAIALALTIAFRKPTLPPPPNEVTVPLSLEDLSRDEQVVIKTYCSRFESSGVTAWKRCIDSETSKAVAGRTKTLPAWMVRR